MKLTATLCTLAGLSVVLAEAPIENAYLPADLAVPNKYIVTYKADTACSDRKDHEDGITRKAKREKNDPNNAYSPDSGSFDPATLMALVLVPVRAVWGANFLDGSPDTDDLGEGTHVAGIIAGKTYGIAKAATVVIVKVGGKAGGSTFYDAAANPAVKVATDAGITVVVAALDTEDDVANYSPASVLTAPTVGVIDGSKTRAWFSCYGTVVDLFAPGVDILSSYYLSDISTWYQAGTGISSAHVAGLAAYFIAKEGLSGYSAVTSRILGAATGGTDDATP
ncbi:peptidase S8/S53 domain-containing protein [Thelonectria olida]|uniref:Peptidase S8/S53 domain-containing protein n=1 Tax=Thelonectria olida TaxID=1576542 RepID=A0A9P8W9Q6_9HYPO|nr:peptidase S8/S53 domain-containing protein [Thelonectria olida]